MRRHLPLCLLILAACGSDDQSGGPSPLVGGIRADVPEMTLVADTGVVTAAALDASGDTIHGAAVAFFNTTPDVALLLADGRFIARRPGVLVLRAVSGQVEQEIRTTVVDTACGRIAAVPGWSGSMGFGYKLDYHHPATFDADSFDVHLEERGTVSGAQLTGPFVLDSETIYWSGVPSGLGAFVHDADTVHHAGGDSVYAEDAVTGAPDDSAETDLEVELAACLYIVDGEPRRVSATSGPGVQADSAHLGTLVSVFGTVTGPGVLSSGGDSLVMAIAHANGYTGGDSTHGQIYLSGLGFLVTQQPFSGQSYPFPSSVTGFDPAVSLALGVGHAVWSFSPDLLAAPPARSERPRRVPRRGRFPHR